MNKQFIAGNWKMNLTLVEARELATKICDALADSDAVDVGVFASYVFLKDICGIFSGSNVTVGAQNMNNENSGAFTEKFQGRC